ncbi:MAG: hypothetical protein ACLGGY_07825 [Gammaproteobacteria bacterium]
MAAWKARDFPRYRAHYASRFILENGQSAEQWASERAQRLGQQDGSGSTFAT